MQLAENVLVIEIVPDSSEVNLEQVLEKIKDELPSYARLVSHKTEPYVYGLYKMEIRVVIPEREGLADEIESILNNIEGITAEVIRMGRL